ncbi:hypothetical protein STEG23_035449 [Scotinomys teguina]
MKSIFFSLSLLLLLEKEAAGVGIYGNRCRDPQPDIMERERESKLEVSIKFLSSEFRSVKNCVGILMGIALNLYIAFGETKGGFTKGGFTKGGFTKGGFTKGGYTSSSSGFMKGHVGYGLKGGREDSAEESDFVQTKHQVYSQGSDMAQTRLSQEHTGVKGATLCRQGQASQTKSQESQIKSSAQTKSHESQVKSYEQAKSHESQMKPYGQLKSYEEVKSHESQRKSYGPQLKSQNAQVKSYSHLNLKSQDAQQKSYGEETQLKSYSQERSPGAQQPYSQLKSLSQAKSLKDYPQQSQHKGFAMNEAPSQVRKQYDDDDDDQSVQQKSSRQDPPHQSQVYDTFRMPPAMWSQLSGSWTTLYSHSLFCRPSNPGAFPETLVFH